MVVVELGGGRAKKGDAIDHAVGVTLHAKVGDHLEEGQPLLTIHANDGQKLAAAKARLLAAYRWGGKPVRRRPVIRKILAMSP
jgi:thymidine phosphorylase